MSKRLALSGLAVVLTLGLVAGFLADFSASEVPEAFAAVCGTAAGLCSPLSDVTRTSALTVEHKDTNTDPVEPDDGETWNITAYWNTLLPTPCYEHQETAVVEVSWNGRAWVLSNETTTGNILQIDVCDADMDCNPDEETFHAWGYKLIVDINALYNNPNGAHNLRQVTYTTTSIDDGYELDAEGCTLGSSLSPDSQTVSRTDTGPFTWISGRCQYGCSISGARVTILYS